MITFEKHIKNKTIVIVNMESNKKVCLFINDKRKKEVFNSIFQLLKSSSSQINLTIDKMNFHVQGMDKSHVCLFDLKLSFEWFDYYEVDQKYEVCFDSGTFYSIISTKCDDQALTFYLEEENTDILFIELKNNETKTSETVKKGDYNKFFKLPLLDYEYQQMVIPNTDYDAEFTLPSKKVTDMLSQLSNFGDDLNVKCSEDCVDFKASGNSVEMRVNIPTDDMSSYAIVEDEIINLTYSLIYISKMCITNKLTDDIDFSLSNESPMKINYNLGNDSLLMFYIAPKISDD
jgi:proliferating cell nuclear antigen